MEADETTHHDYSRQEQIATLAEAPFLCRICQCSRLLLFVMTRGKISWLNATEQPAATLRYHSHVMTKGNAMSIHDLRW